MSQLSRTKISATHPSVGGKITYEEFLARVDEDTMAEWVNSEVIQLGPASIYHQNLSDFLTALLRHFVEAHQLGMVCSAPFQMKLGEDSPGREPDILFLAHEHLDRLEDTYLNGPADLVVEIISPESRSRDRGDKFYEYEQVGIQEYWLLDPIRKQAEFYRLGEKGIYDFVSIDKEGIFRSEVLKGLWLKVDWLWQKPLPLLLTILKEWKIL